MNINNLEEKIDKENQIGLPCGCFVSKNEGAIHIYQNPEIGMELLQCKKCKLIIRIGIMRPERNPSILIPNKRVIG